jgi:hypothetical protein
MFRTVRRKIPWVVVFEVAMMLRGRWKTLPPDDRRRLTALARKSHGNPMALTKSERAEFRRIAMSLDFFGIARDLTPFARRMRRHH